MTKSQLTKINIIRHNKVATVLRSGYSLIEMLVVIAVFSIIAVIATQAITLSLRGAKKSESVIEVKNNVEYAMSTMERLLRNAQSISCSNTLNPPAYTTASVLTYMDEFGNTGRFSCLPSSPGVYYIASGSATTQALTNSGVVTINRSDNCNTLFNCTSTGSSPPVVEIKINATNPNNAILGAEGASVDAQTRVMLRTY